MDEADLAQATSKDESDLEAVPQNDATGVGTRPTFLGRTQQCVSGIWGCTRRRSDDCLGSSKVLSYLPIYRHRKRASRMPIISLK
jgi:hypothetical protein